MHTDEYEISIGREISLCLKKVRQLQDFLERQAQLFGRSESEFIKALEDGSLSEPHSLQSYQHKRQELCYWQKMLLEYQTALNSLK